MKFSVIVPVYGVEKYLDQCVESMLAQSFRDFELILVDDCSPDNCPAMCDVWAEKDERIRVIHKPENEGLGFARNTGLCAAKGEYVLFLDSDDYIADTLLETCSSRLTEQTDILVFGLQYVYQDKRGRTVLVENAVPPERCAESPEARAALFADLNRAGAFPFAWNKVYRKAFLNDAGVLFEKTKLIEDFLFNITLFDCAGRIDSIGEQLYSYRKPAHETLVSRYNPDFFALSKRKYCLEETFLRNCGCLDGANLDLIRLGYVKHLVSAVLKNQSRAASLTVAQQRERIGRMMDDPLTVKIVSEYVPADWKFRLVAEAVRKRQISLLMIYCTGIGFIQQNMLPLYRRLLKK